MFLFGHIGITLGVAVLGTGIYNVLHERQSSPEKEHPVQPGEKTAFVRKVSVFSPSAWIKRLHSFLDIRFLLIGSMLPDIIDKPVGYFFFRSTFHNGRIFSHTLLFLLVILLTGVFLRLKSKKTWFLALDTGTLMHLILDQMWNTPLTLLWPLYGWGFPSFDDSDIFWIWLRSLVHEPSVYIPEIIVFVILVGYGIWMVRRNFKLRKLALREKGIS